MFIAREFFNYLSLKSPYIDIIAFYYKDQKNKHVSSSYFQILVIVLSVNFQVLEDLILDRANGQLIFSGIRPVNNLKNASPTLASPYDQNY